MKVYFWKIAIVIVALSVVTLALSKWAEWNIERNIPNIIHEAIAGAKKSKSVKRKIGEVLSEESRFNTRYLDGDTLNYLIILTGDKARMDIRARARKTKTNEWHIESSDTIFTIY